MTEVQHFNNSKDIIPGVDVHGQRIGTCLWCKTNPSKSKHNQCNSKPITWTVCCGDSKDSWD